VTHAEQLRALLLDRSVRRGDFLLASGRRSDYYVDARRTTMSGAGQELIGQLALERLRVRGWHPAAIGGLTLGADPVAYAVAASAHRSGLVLDAFTVRKAPKPHGAGGRIEGCFAAGADVVIAEDVITTGQSALAAIRAVEEAGGRVVGVLAVVDREEGGRGALEAAGYPVEVLVAARDLGIAGNPG